MPDMLSTLAGFFDPVALLLVAGGSFAVAAVRGTGADLVAAMRAAGALFRRGGFDGVTARAQIAALDRISRRHGPAALGDQRVDDPALRRMVAAIAGNAGPEEVSAMLDADLATRARRHAASQDFWIAVAEAAPAMGMIGTLVGLVRMFAAIDDPSRIGAAMAVALLTTLYGALIANVIAAPIAARLARLSARETEAREALRRPLEAIAARGDHVPAAPVYAMPR